MRPVTERPNLGFSQSPEVNTLINALTAIIQEQGTAINYLLATIEILDGRVTDLENAP